MREIPLQDIQSAAASIYDFVVRTPLVRLALPDTIAQRIDGSEIFLKLETLQPIGSFKIRGAWNTVRQLTPDELRDGVWTVKTSTVAGGWRSGPYFFIRCAVRPARCASLSGAR